MVRNHFVSVASLLRELPLKIHPVLKNGGELSQQSYQLDQSPPGRKAAFSHFTESVETARWDGGITLPGLKQ